MRRTHRRRPARDATCAFGTTDSPQGSHTCTRVATSAPEARASRKQAPVDWDGRQVGWEDANGVIPSPPGWLLFVVC